MPKYILKHVAQLLNAAAVVSQACKRSSGTALSQREESFTIIWSHPPRYVLGQYFAYQRTLGCQTTLDKWRGANHTRLDEKVKACPATLVSGKFE